MVIKNNSNADGQSDPNGGSPASNHPNSGSSQRDSYAEADIIRLSLFLRRNPMPILVCSPDGTVIKLNPAAEKLLRVLHLPELELLPVEHEQFVQTCLAGTHTIPAIERIVGDRVFAITYNPVLSFNLVYLYVVEITDYRRAEDEFLQFTEKTIDPVKHAVMQLRATSRQWHWGLQDFETSKPANQVVFATMDGCVFAIGDPGN